MIPRLTFLLFGSLEPVTQPPPSPSKYKGYLKICMTFSEGNSTKILIESVDNWGIDTVCLAVPERLSVGFSVNIGHCLYSYMSMKRKHSQ